VNITKSIVFGAVLLFGLSALAQDFPKIEVAVDYSYACYAASHAYTSSYSLNGAGGSVDFNFTPHLGIKMDLQGYGSNTQRFTAAP